MPARDRGAPPGHEAVRRARGGGGLRARPRRGRVLHRVRRAVSKRNRVRARGGLEQGIAGGERGGDGERFAAVRGQGARVRGDDAAERREEVSGGAERTLRGRMLGGFRDAGAGERTRAERAGEVGFVLAGGGGTGGAEGRARGVEGFEGEEFVGAERAEERVRDGDEGDDRIHGLGDRGAAAKGWEAEDDAAGTGDVRVHRAGDARAALRLSSRYVGVLGLGRVHVLRRGGFGGLSAGRSARGAEVGEEDCGDGGSRDARQGDSRQV